MSRLIEQCETVVKDLIGDDIVGAMVVRRDGIPAITHGRELDKETLAAMVAAVAGAGDVCLQTIGSAEVDSMDLRTHGACMAIFSLDSEYILVAITPDDKTLDQADQSLRAARQAIREGMSGS